MKLNWKKIIGIIAGLAIIALVIVKLMSNKEISQEKVYLYNKDEVIQVQVDTIQLENVTAEYTYTGTFEPNKETKLSSEIQGKINKVLVDVGSNVKQGQSLIQLDNSLLKLQLQTIQVQIEGLEADVNRYSILVKADAIQGVQLEKSELALKSAKIQLATVQEQIAKSTVKAPFNAIVTAKLSEEGAFAAPGMPLLQLTDIANLKFTINVPEKDLKLFTLNQIYTTTADAYPEISLTGKVSMIGSKANMGSSFPIQFAVNNTSDLKIKSGMFGKVSSIGIETKANIQQDQGIIISSSAIIGTSDQPQVYLVKDGKAILQNIVISNKIQNKVVVASGLKAGDILITSGFINLFNGANVSNQLPTRN